MAESLSLALPQGISLKKRRHVLDGAGEISFEITAPPGSDVLAALLANAPFPARHIDLADLSVGVTGERDFQLDGGKGKVTFNGKASGYERLTILDDPGEVTALLVRDKINDDIVAGLAIRRRPDHRFGLLRWGYDLQGSAKGAVALGFGAQATFGAEAKRLGAYAVVRQFPEEVGAGSAVAALLQS